MTQTIITRFAPSPTGLLHVGNSRTAIMAWLFARKNKGKFILRLDDTDLERSTEEYAEKIKRDLTWLGLTWDETFRQSERLDRYKAALDHMIKTGRAYACYETGEGLALKRKTLLSRGLPPLYDREGLRLTPEKIQQYEAEGRKPHWRFKLNHTAIEWDDLVRGKQHFEGKDLSDPVLVREDGHPLFNLSAVVDDIDEKVTHILRGEDHVTNTAVQIQMFEALSTHMPTFGHLALIADKEGKGLSKRLGSLSLESFHQEMNIEPFTVLCFMGKLGTSDAIDLCRDVDHLIAEFDFAKISRSTAKFDLDELLRLNAKIVKSYHFDQVKNHLIENKLTHITPEFWEAVKGNLNNVLEVQNWWQMVHNPIEPIVEDRAFLDEALKLLPAEPWDENSWKIWTDLVKDKTGAKGKDLFMPLRKALTAQEHGPEMKVMMPLIGYEKVLSRLKGNKA